MAKQQTFGDKLKKKKGEEKPIVKVIQSYRNDEGNLKFLEKFIRVDDLNALDKVDISK